MDFKSIPEDQKRIQIIFVKGRAFIKFPFIKFGEDFEMDYLLSPLEAIKLGFFAIYEKVKRGLRNEI